MRKFAALFLSLLLSLSLAAPAALCAGEEPCPLSWRNRLSLQTRRNLVGLSDR